jgi:peptidoglycan/LPS O-acetylase OafA/YrhL
MASIIQVCERAAPADFRLGYRPALDGLRALAVLAVMAYHSPLGAVLGGGFLGVDLFFVLSGFLITATLLEEHQSSGTIRLGRFYLRRARRLFPALYLLLGFCCLLALGCRSPARAQQIYRPVLLTACYAANWYWCFGVQLRLLGHAWSLGVEEQFYLAWPLLLAALLRLGAGRRTVAAVIVAGIVAAALLRAVLWQGPQTMSHHAITTCLLTRGDALLAGCLAGACAGWGWLPRRRRGIAALRALAAASAALLVVWGVTARPTDTHLYRGGFTLVTAAAAVCVAALVHAPSRIASLLSAAPLVWVGRVSYGLYLWHFPLFALVPSWLHKLTPGRPAIPAVTWAVQVGLTFAVAALSFHLVEQPLRQKHKS